MRGLRASVVLCGLLTGLLAGSAAWAQTVTLEPSVVARCLTAPAGSSGLPTYPFVQYKSNEPGRVRVALDFSAPDERPTVTVLSSDGDSVFVDAVKQHARSLRLPCLPASSTVRLLQEFVFQTDQRAVFSGRPVDAADAERRKMLECMTHSSGTRAPNYPHWAREENVQGRVLVSLTFSAPDRAPVAKVDARPSARRLARTIEYWVKDLRLPCHTGGPVQAKVVYMFVFEGEAYGFKGLTLQELMSRAKGIEKQRLQLDTTTMGCPFDLKFTYFQPSMDNSVGSLGNFDPARRPLLDWLAGVELDLPRASLDSVFADTADVAVPCIKINLNPQE